MVKTGNDRAGNYFFLFDRSAAPVNLLPAVGVLRSASIGGPDLRDSTGGPEVLPGCVETGALSAIPLIVIRWLSTFLASGVLSIVVIMIKDT